MLPGCDLRMTVSQMLGGVVSSTASASVFAIHRSKELKLKHNLRPLQELESGSNAPMAYMLTITLIQVNMAEGQAKIWLVVLMYFYQMIVVGISG